MTLAQDQPVKLVRDLMHIGVITCRTYTPLVEAAAILLREHLDSLVVLDEQGHAVGLLGQQEAIEAYARSCATSQTCHTLTAAEVMRPEIPEIPPDIPAAAAAQIMLDLGVRGLYLMHHDGGISWPAAVLRAEDVLHHLVDGA
jgi:CBS-domain-containing membrane protein